VQSSTSERSVLVPNLIHDVERSWVALATAAELLHVPARRI
jgi:hypothetical protein